MVLFATVFVCAMAWAIPVTEDGNAAPCDADTVTGKITYTPSAVYEDDQVTLYSSYTYSGATVAVTGYKWECSSNCGTLSSISNSTSASGAKFTANTAGSVQIRLAISYKCNQAYNSTDYTYKTITINENCTEQTYYLDADGDGYGSAGTTQSACEQPDGYSLFDNDCDDGDAAVNTGEAEVCENSKDDDCDGMADESCDTTSCNEKSATYLSFHSYFDFCNCPDDDNDGIYEYCGNDGNSHHSMCNTYFFPSGNFDCNDNNPSISPTACETCGDNVDNDCDGEIDEDCPVTTTETPTAETTTTETPTTETPTTETPSTTVANSPPVADAGDNQTVTAGATVTLDGSGSTDPDGDTLTYSWAETSSYSVSLASSTTVSPTFTPQTAGSYTFQLTVDDGNGETDTDQVIIVVSEVSSEAGFSPDEGSSPTTSSWGSELLGSGCSLVK